MEQRNLPQAPSRAPREREALSNVARTRFTTAGSLLALGALGLLVAGCPGAADLEPGDYADPPASGSGATAATGSGGTGNSGTGGGGSGTAGTGTAGTGTAGTGTAGTGTVVPDCSAKQACVTTAFQPCIACHGGPTSLNFEKLDLSPGGLPARLVNVGARHETGGATCPKGDKLVDTATPANSWLLKKIVKDGPGSCGTAMPSSAGLSADEITCVSSWINCLAGK